MRRFARYSTTACIALLACVLPVPFSSSANAQSTVVQTHGPTTTLPTAALDPSHGWLFARASLINTVGQSIGTAMFAQDVTLGLVWLSVQVQDRTLAPGLHGIHIHAIGACTLNTSPDFASAGGHFNPQGKQHGLRNPNGPHAGDLPNIMINGNGYGRLDAVTDLVTLTSGDTSLFHTEGTSLVIHAGMDDEMTNPAGNSGARVACGIIQPFPMRG